MTQEKEGMTQKNCRGNEGKELRKSEESEGPRG
jgi:hypothetical protein